MKLATRTALIEPFHAMEFGKRAAALQAQGRDIVRLSIGEPDFPVPPLVVEAMRDACAVGRTPYTAALGLPALREAIAAWQSDAFGADVDASRVIVTAGASAALLLVAAALVEPGDEVLVGDPSYPCNRRFVEGFGGRARLVPTTVAGRFQLTAACVEAAWGESTRGAMIATPSNPTGTSVPLDALEAMCTAIAERGGWALVDEIYLPLSYGPPSDGTDEACAPRSILSRVPSAITVGSFSKYWAMPGWRLGWAIVPETLVPVIERLAQNFYICPSAPTQYAALACFASETLDECERRRQRLAARRQRVLAGLASAGYHVPVAPDGAFYVWIDAGALGIDSATLAGRLLDEAGVALTPGLDFGPAGARDFLRLSYAADEADLDRAIEAMAAFRARLGG